MKEDFENAISLLGDISEMLINLAGNNNIREKAIRDTDLEKEVNPYCTSIDYENIVDLLHRIEHMKITLGYAADWAEHIQGTVPDLKK